MKRNYPNSIKSLNRNNSVIRKTPGQRSCPIFVELVVDEESRPRQWSNWIKGQIENISGISICKKEQLIT